MTAAQFHAGRRRVLKTLLGLGIGSLTGAGSWGYFYERFQLSAEESDVPVAGLPQELDGLRVALLTDMHRSTTVPASIIEQAVTLARTAAPDLIVLGGDYVTWGERGFVQPAAEALAGLDAPCGVFAVLGNHDDDRDMPAALKRLGYTVLKDARTSVSIRGVPVDLIGIRFWTRRTTEIERVVRGATGFPILLAHDPRRVAQAAALGIPLTLSGHTHGGQVVLPGLGPVAYRKGPVIAGLGFNRQSTVFVSRGIGTVYVPIRLNCPPEVSILTLKIRREERTRTAVGIVESGVGTEDAGLGTQGSGVGI